MINEILNLEVSNDSVKKINKYINKLEINDENHSLAVSHLISLYFQTKQLEEVKNILENFLPKYNNYNAITILNKTIELTQFEYKEECIEAINKKKDLLESYDIDQYYIDMINYNHDNILERIRYINLYLQDDTSRVNRLNGMYLLAKAYMDNNSFYNFEPNLEITKELALELGRMDIFESLISFQATDLYNKNKFDEALAVINTNSLKSEHFHNVTNLLQLKILFKQEKYKKCSILEGKCESSISKATKEIQKEFYELCIKLYTIIPNKISIDLYKSKIQELEYKKEYDKLELTIEEKIISTKIKKDRKQETKIETPAFKNIKKIKPSLNEMSDFYQDTTSIFSAFYKENIFREKLRLSLVNLNKQVNFNDCYIITNDESFHFKKERLYDKKDVNLSIIDSFHDSNTEIISFNTLSDNIKNPFNNEILEYNTVTIFPLFTDKCYGAIYFASSDDNMISGKLNYEKLHIFAKFYNSISIINKDRDDQIRDNKAQLEIMKSNYFYYGYIENDYFYCNNETKLFLNTSLKTSINSFFSIIHTNDYLDLFKAFNFLEVGQYIEKVVLLTNEKKVLFKITKHDEFKYLFIFVDHTDIENKKDELIVTAYHNPITKLKNNESLNIEMSSYFDMKKFSAILINFKDLRKYTYLYQEKFSLDILKYIGKILPLFNKEYDYYHLNFDKLIVLVKDVNDKRILKQIITKLNSYLVNNLSELNSRLIPNFTYGTYRSFVDTKEKTVNKMLEILSDSVLNVSNSYDEYIGFYDSDEYKKRFLKEQLVTYISEAIDQKSIKVLYSQCVNVKDNLVEYYEAKLNLSNYTVDSNLLQEVITRRNLTTQLEQYLINRTFHEMNLIYTKTNFSINVLISIDEYTLVKNSFVNFLSEKVKQYKVNPKRIIFKIEKVYPQAVENIALLIEQGFNFLVTNIDDLSLIKPNYFLFNNFKTLNIFNDEYIKTISKMLEKLDVKFILGDTLKNNVIEHYKEYINYFEGDVYSEKISYLDITKLFTDIGI